ncbi:MAG: hypothetical protein QOI03_497, partial [Solirubrobacteraceae bacterium]|nr:hypothetical protein [Solirubrobacteraceae bacterium]
MLALVGAALLSVLLALALGALPSLAPSRESVAPRAHPLQQAALSLSPALLASASSSIGASERSFWPVRRAGALVIARGGVHGAFTSSGVSLRVPTGALELSLTGTGRGRSLRAVPAATPAAAANQILYRRGAITEQYTNGPFGLEQGFTLARRPQLGVGPVALALHLGGSLSPQQLGSQILFKSGAGATALRYGGLSVLDAAGRELPARMQLRGRTLQLLVDDRLARYPLRIDPFFQQGSKLVGSDETGQGQLGFSAALAADGNTALIGGPVDNSEVGAAWVFTRSGTSWTQQGAKLTGTGESGKALFGSSVSLSADGNTALIGARRDGVEIGAAWVFTRSGSSWTQQGSKLTAGTEEKGAGQFGIRVALSGDGNTALIGAPRDNSQVGAAWVFVRSGSTWEHQGKKLLGTGEEPPGEVGESVALSFTGDAAVLGAGADNLGAGAAFMFTRSGSTWTQQGSKLTGGEELGTAHFGFSVSLSSDASTALIGGGGDNGEVGAAWVFTRTGSTWAQQGSKLTGAGELGTAHFGFSVSLSSDGATALIGGGGDNGEVGAAWVFTRTGSTWSQQGSKLTGAGEVGKAHFGYSVALSGDASTAMIGGIADNNLVGAAWPFSTATPPPTVASITPTSGTTTGGTAVKIKGTGFVTGATVTIGSEATSVTVLSATEITATTAATAAGSDEVVVSDVNGTSSGGPSFTYVTPAAPVVSSITPSSGPEAGGTKVTIMGSGFAAGATVSIGNAATSVVVVSATKITATTAATPAGSDEVIVSDVNGTSTAGPSYTYLPPPAPKVTSILPTSGTVAGGTKVNIKGSGFVAGATVTIGSPATSVVVVSATTITAVTAANAAGPVEVVVSDANGTSTGGPTYTYLVPPPKVTSISPTSGPAGGGTKVTIKGSGFVAPATVTIGSAATSVVVVS